MKIPATRLGFILVFLVSFWILLPAVAPHITTGDAAELALSGSTLGVAHSPGYPVFSLVNKTVGDLLIFGNSAYRQNIVSSLFLTLTLVFLGAILVLVTGQRWALGLPMLLLFSGVFRHHAYVTEVFPLTVFWGIFLLFVTLAVGKSRFALPLIGFLVGIGAGVHQTLVLTLPAVSFFLVSSRLVTWKRFKNEFPFLLFFLMLGASIYLYLPFRSITQPVLDWEDPESWDRFIGVLTRARYGFFQLAQGSSLHTLSFPRLWEVMVFSKNFLVENVGWVGIILVLFGSLQCLAHRFSRRFMATLWIFIFFTGPFFFWLTNISLNDGNDILSRFTLLPLSASFLLMSLALVPLWTSRLPLYRCFMVVLLIAFGVEGFLRRPFFLKSGSIPQFNRESHESGVSMRWDLSMRETALNMIRMIPDKSILFSDRADETEFSLAYLFLGEARKPDTRFVDCNAGVTRSIYGDDYYRIWGTPRLRIREKVESKILEEASVPVFYATLDPTMIDIFRTPRGLLYRAWPLQQVRESAPVSWDKLVCWRFFPRELRGVHLYRTNLDLLGRALFERGFSDGAARSFGLAQRAGGAHRFEMMGYWHQIRGESNLARDYYQKVFSVGGFSESLFSNLGALELEAGRRDEAISIYQRGLKQYQNSVKLLYNLAVAYWQEGRFEDVKQVVEKIIIIDPKNSEALRLLTGLKTNGFSL